jgi:hypothetical protein
MYLQNSHPYFWPAPSNNAGQTSSLPYSDDSPTSERDDYIRWQERFHPRPQPINPQGPATWRHYARNHDSNSDNPRRQAPVDLHSSLTRRARIEASRIENPEAPQFSQTQPPRGDVEGFSHAIQVLQHDGLSSTRSRQLIARFNNERIRRPSDSRNVTSSEPLSSPWGIVEQAGTSASDPRVPGGASNSEPDGWGNNIVAARATEMLFERLRTNPASALSDSDRERMVQGQRRIRFARQREIGSMFAPSAAMDPAGRFGRRGRAMGDYMVCS